MSYIPALPNGAAHHPRVGYACRREYLNGHYKTSNEAYGEWITQGPLERHLRMPVRPSSAYLGREMGVVTTTSMGMPYLQAIADSVRAEAEHWYAGSRVGAMAPRFDQFDVEEAVRQSFGSGVDYFLKVNVGSMGHVLLRVAEAYDAKCKDPVRIFERNEPDGAPTSRAPYALPQFHWVPQARGRRRYDFGPNNQLFPPFV